MRVPFQSSARASVGIEWELQLVDRQTRDLSSSAKQLLAELSPDGEHPKAKHELFQSTLEVITGVCQTVGEAAEDLSGTIAQLTELADARGLGLLCAGTHPFAEWSDQQVSPSSRYYRLVHQTQWLARRLLIFGIHVHVGVRSPDKAVPIVTALTAYVPHLLALSAASPFWVGRDTGLASTRAKIFETLPTAGLPHQVGDWAGFEGYLDTMTRARAIDSIKDVWWDIRPHPDFGTVELRIADGLPTLTEVTAQAALAQCLVQRMDDQLDAGCTLPVPLRYVVQENKWRAARYGLDAEILVDERGTTQPAREALVDLVAELAPYAGRLGCADQLAGVAQILEVGASYQRQRAVARAADGDLTAVVDTLLEEMRTGLRG